MYRGTWTSEMWVNLERVYRHRLQRYAKVFWGLLALLAWTTNVVQDTRFCDGALVSAAWKHTTPTMRTNVASATPRDEHAKYINR